MDSLKLIERICQKKFNYDKDVRRKTKYHLKVYRKKSSPQSSIPPHLNQKDPLLFIC